MMTRRRFIHPTLFVVVWVTTTIMVFTVQSGGVDAFQIIQQPMASNAAWDLYKTLLKRNPLLTNSVASSCIMSLSDVICQELVIKSKSSNTKDNIADGRSATKLDYTRTLQVAITGFFWSAPVTHYWYSTLEKLYNSIANYFSINNPVIALFIKLLLDASIFSPITISGYFAVRSILEGTGLAGAKEKWISKFKPTILSAWKFWPVVNSVNFWFVPLQFRVLYMNVLAFIWSAYLTYVNSQKISTTP